MKGILKKIDKAWAVEYRAIGPGAYVSGPGIPIAETLHLPLHPSDIEKYPETSWWEEEVYFNVVALYEAVGRREVAKLVSPPKETWQYIQDIAYREWRKMKDKTKDRDDLFISFYFQWLMDNYDAPTKKKET